MSKTGKKRKKQTSAPSSAGSGFLRYAIVVTAAFALYLCFFASNSVLNWVKAGFEIRRQEKTMEKYREEIDEMDRKIKLLTTNRDSLEKYARERYRFAAPDEDVYIEEK